MSLQFVRHLYPDAQEFRQDQDQALVLDGDFLRLPGVELIDLQRRECHPDGILLGGFQSLGPNGIVLGGYQTLNVKRILHDDFRALCRDSRRCAEIRILCLHGYLKKVRGRRRFVVARAQELHLALF